MKTGNRAVSPGVAFKNICQIAWDSKTKQGVAFINIQISIFCLVNPSKTGLKTGRKTGIFYKVVEFLAKNCKHSDILFRFH